jgi:hypothetical protein
MAGSGSGAPGSGHKRGSRLTQLRILLWKNVRGPFPIPLVCYHIAHSNTHDTPMLVPCSHMHSNSPSTCTRLSACATPPTLSQTKLQTRNRCGLVVELVVPLFLFAIIAGVRRTQVRAHVSVGGCGGCGLCFSCNPSRKHVIVEMKHDAKAMCCEACHSTTHARTCVTLMRMAAVGTVASR